MTPSEIGEEICRLRKLAGWTQQSLADALFITDKAISKWERGLSSPDSSILPKLAALLDTDVHSLIAECSDENPWFGRLVLHRSETRASTLLRGVPIVEYLLSYFLLLKITDVEILTDDEEEKEFIKKLSLEKYGFNLSFEERRHEKTMIVDGKFLLFGAYFTKQLLTMASVESNVRPVLCGKPLPILFSRSGAADEPKKRSLFRGMINLPLETFEQVSDAESFIALYEKNHSDKICSLDEIAKNRGI